MHAKFLLVNHLFFSDAESKGVEDTTVNVWEDNWDDDAKEDDFANQLR